jgi:RimJ/RimL family protein N-acetyltransferase
MWSADDKAPFAALNADPRVMEHFPSTLTAQQSNEMVDRHTTLWHERGWGLWAVDRLDTGEFIGFVGLSSPTWTAHFTPCVEVGWRLAAAHWGHGFAGEAAVAAVDWGFDNVAEAGTEIVSFTTQGNANSRRVMHKLGFTHTAADDFDHPTVVGELRRHVVYRMQRSTWAASRPAG